MLLDNLSVNIWLHTEPVDMRKQFDGLAALVQSKLGCRANSGELFVFINRKRTQMKVLYYNQGGYCLWSKRLERGHYQRLQHGTGKMALDWTQLQCLIGGIHWQKSTINLLNKQSKLLRSSINLICSNASYLVANQKNN